MKRNRNPTNKSVMKRYATLDSSIGSRSSSVRAPFILRSSSVRAPFGLRSGFVGESKIDRRSIGDSSEARRRCIETLMGSQGKGDPNKNFIFNHLNSNYYGKTYRNYFQTQWLCR